MSTPASVQAPSPSDALPRPTRDFAPGPASEGALSQTALPCPGGRETGSREEPVFPAFTLLLSPSGCPLPVLHSCVCVCVCLCSLLLGLPAVPDCPHLSPPSLLPCPLPAESRTDISWELGSVRRPAALGASAGPSHWVVNPSRASPPPSQLCLNKAHPAHTSLGCWIPGRCSPARAPGRPSTLLAELRSGGWSAWPARGQGGLGQGCRSAGSLSLAGPIAFCPSCPWWVSLALPALPDTPETCGTDCDHLDVSPAQTSLFRRLHGASAGGALKMALGGPLLRGSPWQRPLGDPTWCGCWRDPWEWQQWGWGKPPGQGWHLRWSLGPQAFQPVECPASLASDSLDPGLVTSRDNPARMARTSPSASSMAHPGHPSLGPATQTAPLSLPPAAPSRT